MIIFDNHSYQITSGHPNENFLAGFDCQQPKWVVDDNSELAEKILSSPCWEPVMDSEGILTDIIPVDIPTPEITAKEKSEEFKAQLDEIDKKTIRSLRAIVTGMGSEEDREMLLQLEKQAKAIRSQLEELVVEENG